MVKSNEDLTLSPREVEVLALAWQCFETEPKVDMEKLAVLAGYTKQSATVTLGKIKKKMRNAASASCAIPVTPKKSAASTPKSKSGGKRVISALPTDDDDDHIGVGETPSKKAKKERKIKDDDDEFASVKVKKEECNDLLASANDFFNANMTRDYDYGGI